MGKNETVYHFVGECPILKGVRKFWFKNESLNEYEFFEWLNGRDWRVLGGFLRDSWEKRWSLIQEYNF
jgi:hypothetical protein